ncbi:MAG: PolC-type DNA polymerase III [Clostridia bacterium]|nr:PolC-type DNA polymerase III [Clostridia bacterium]
MSDKRYKFTDVFQKVAVPDEIGALTIKNAFLERESNVLYLNLLEYLSEERKSEISSLLTSQFAFNGVVVDCAESEPETEPDPAAEPQPTPEHVDDTVAETKADAAAEIPEVQTAAEENTDIFTFADVLNRVTSKSPPAASLLAGCKYTVSGSTITITLTKGGKSYLDARGVTAYLEKQMRAACDKPYTIVYDGTIVVDNTDNDEEILALSTELSTEANVKRERVLLGDKITKATVQMASISEDTGKVCVEGDIFKIDTRETRDGSKLRATIFITDYTASVALKLEDYTDKLGRVMEKLSEGTRIRVRGIMRYDRFFGDMCLFADDIMTVPKQTVPDTAEEKRVELHLHTNMSSMDGVNDIADYVKRASEWGHKAIAVTDHGVVQSYPAAAAASKKYGVKMLYGVEDYFINDVVKAFAGDADVSLDGEFTVFDIETTGTTLSTDRITEIAAVKFRGGEVEEEFQTFCNPEKPISEKIQGITGITNEMVADAPKEGEAVRMFLDFCGDSVLVAHNAAFDTSFIAAACGRSGMPYAYSHVDTIPLCRKYYPQLKNMKLDTVARLLGYGDFRHHRALDDTKVLAAIFRDLVEKLKADGVSDTSGLNGALDGMNTNSMHRFHQVLLVKNKTGLKNLYKLISKAHIDNFYYQPRIKKSDLNALREGLIVGSACVEGELYRAVLEARSEEEIREIADYYDYFEIQPVANNEFLINDDDITSVNSKDDIRAINKKIVELGEKLGKPVVATGDVHFLTPRDSIFREVLMDAVGFQSGETESELYFRSTDNMLREFSYLGEEKAYEVVVTNTNKIADMIEDIIPVPDGTFTPSIEGAESSFRDNTYARAHEIYGDPLPEIVENRLAKEVNSVINNGFSVMYESARRIVMFSEENGYIVGSRGSVGSSFAATMAGITEINPLPPHYVCRKCKHSEFITDGSVKSGFELDGKPCPVCGEMMIGDGHDIPFETFLGFHGEKAPDIDLNISGEFQSTVHKYVDSLFGAEYCFKAGTISVIQDRTAFGFVKKYLEKRGKLVSNAEIERLVTGVTGVKRTTGQHPGGIVVVPKGYEIYDFTPVQRPADKSDSDIITTHFDFNSMHDTLLKLDLLGHDVPTLAKHLTDMTDTPFTSVPLNDNKVMSLFTSPEALGVDAKQINCETGTLGLPEMGTEFVRQMLVEAQPKKFSDLLQISGLSHGTDVWLGNAQDLIKNNVCTISEVIGTRDDIMVYLMHKGLPSDQAFSIMEKVRKKNKTLSEDDEKLMKSNGVPDWYLDSCKKIKYMFPKAHAAAYVMSAIRLGWYKVYRPREFYAALFTVRPDGFDAETMSGGLSGIKSKRAALLAKLQESGTKMSANDKNALNVMDLSIEMYSRGISFLPVDIYKSDPFRFVVEGDGIRMPFIAVAGLGDSVATALAEARKESRFSTQEDIKNVSGVSKSIVEAMDHLGAFAGIPKSSQLTFF